MAFYLSLGVKDYKKNGLTRGPFGNFLQPSAGQYIVELGFQGYLVDLLWIHPNLKV